MQYTILRVRARSETYVVRVPNAEQAADYEGAVDFADLIAKEAVLHPALVRAGVPQPELIGWSRRQHDDDHSWMLLEHVVHDDVAVLSGGQQGSLGQTTRRIHSGSVADTTFSGPGGSGVPESLLRRVRMRYDHAKHIVPLPPWTAIEPVVRWAVLADEESQRPGVVHMDLRPCNLCFRADVLVAVLDLTNGMVASRFAELGRLYAYEWLTPSFLDGYGSGDLSDEDELRIRAYAVDTLTMLVGIAAAGLAGRGLLSTAGRRLRALASALAAEPRRDHAAG